MPENIGRHIKPEAERELWGRAAARCEFNGCNQLLYLSPVTQEPVNLAEKGHIYSFAENGPRGRGPYKDNPVGLNDLPNLILVCQGCHKTIDKDKQGTRYSADLLRGWKDAHETRIRIVTGISPSKKSHVVIYGSRVGDERSPLQNDRLIEAMFPDWYPAEERPLNLSMTSALNDSTSAFWETEASHLAKEFDRHVRTRIEEGNPNHFSVFALAPQPLLILLGSLFTDKVPTNVYQLHREPQTWQWQPHPEDFKFKVHEPANKDGQPVLIISLSAKIASERITTVLSEHTSIWEITIAECHNDFLLSEAQLTMFRQTIRKLMENIKAAHPKADTLTIFPAMPVACAIELGRVRMPKADLFWHIYDQNNKHQKFIPALTIGKNHG